MSAASPKPPLPPPGLFEEQREEAESGVVLTPAAAVARMVEDPRRRGFLAKHPRPARSGPPRRSKSDIERARAQMEEMARSGDWESASGTHLVALYAWLHAEVYGVENAELDGKAWGLAAQAAGRMVANHFSGDYGAAVLFLRWAWKREQGREAWRRENGRDGGRIGWRLQFGGSLVTDYRVDAARRSK